MRGKSAVNETEYLVILGCQVNGSLASLPLLRRGYNAVNYLKRHENVKAVITGGQGPRENITEAEAMRRLLTENGIDEERILIEDKSRSTIENLKFANELYNLIDKNIVIVTSDYHMFRSLSIAKKLGYKNAAGLAATSQLSVLPAYLLREYAAVMYYALSGKI
ncbi:MAG: YdcF family protein [Treponema sp.]|nr:YdcF family protein [Treponema sp.]